MAHPEKEKNGVEINLFNYSADGATTQYRQKTQLYMSSTMFYDKCFKGGCSWNFFEDGHDNWAADGFGGDLKWTADKFDLIQPRSEQPQSCHDYNAEI